MISSFEDLQYEAQLMQTQIAKLSLSNKQLLSSFGSQLILQSPYIDESIRQSLCQTNQCEISQLQKRYQGLSMLNQQSVQQRKILCQDLEKYRRKQNYLKEEIQRIEGQASFMQEQLHALENDVLQQEKLQQSYQEQLLRRNTQLIKQITQTHAQQNQFKTQIVTLQQQLKHYEKLLSQERQQLKQQEFLYKKKQEQEKLQLSQLAEMKRQMLRKKQKMMKTTFGQMPKELSRNVILKEISDIQSLIQNFKKNKRLQEKGKKISPIKSLY